MAIPRKVCGDALPPEYMPVLDNGATIPFFITGTDPDIGGGASQVVDMTAEVADFIPSVTGLDGTFIICIETAAAIQVQLATGEDFTITAVQATAYLGQWYPGKLLKVYKTGTTGTFSVGT